jgi:uncharacterized protein YkwD
MRIPRILAVLLALQIIVLLGSTLDVSATARVAPSPVAGHTASRAKTVTPRSDAWEAKVLRLTNARRKAHGVRPLKANRCADRLAERWTRHMARTQVLEHQSLTPFFDCPHTSYAGENIAYGYETPRALVSAWMHSPGHRANILSRHFHRIGVAGWRATNGQTYATQDFLG